MTFQLNIDDILAIASNGGYQANVSISDTTALTLLSVLSALYNTSYWTNDINDLDRDDIDIIDELLSLANYELMTQVQVGGMEVGTTFLWWSSTLPANTLECDGTQYLKADYPDLSALLGAEFSVGADNFVVPDLRDRVPVGAGAEQINDAGGEDEVTLTVAEMPSHNHEYASGINQYVLLQSAPPPQVVTRQNGEATGAPYVFSPATNNRGGDQAHNNMQPYRVAKYVIQAQ